MKLTEQQKRAAEAPGSVAVTAGAGTGKTSMLAARYLHHVQSHGMSPLSVVAVTFTDKAADELRSRIRKTLTENLSDEKVIAEVEAAQISTMHALAARVCRDFYDLAGIPADFSILDDTEKPLWVAEKFEEAVSRIDPEIVGEIGFAWLTSAMSVLLKDPYSSEHAISLGSTRWRAAIEEARTNSVADLTASAEWRDSEDSLRACRGKAGDKLEAVRVDALNAMVDDPEIVQLQIALKQFRSNSGAAANWDKSELDRVRGCLVELKKAVNEAFQMATLTFGAEDEKAVRWIDPLTAAFRQVRSYIAAEKLRERVLDFSDLEQYALKILEHQEALDHYKLRWHAFLVDEFQDTNPIQSKILEKLAKSAILTIVGDEKQAIYGFRGADVGVFSRVRQQIVDERAGDEVPLSRTFRTHDELVSKMNSVFEPVLGELHQPLKAERMESHTASPYFTSAVVETVPNAKSQLQILEARYIAEKIAELHADGVAYHDIAILSRTWQPLDIYLDVLSANKIPAVHAGGGSLLATREAMDVYALFCFLTEPNDDIPLVAILRSPFFAISDKTLFEASKDLRKGVSWWQLISGRSEFKNASLVLEELLASRSSKSPEQIMQLADNLTGYGAVIANMPHGNRRSADLRGVFELFRRLERRGQGDIFGTTRYIRELLETETEIPRPPLDAGEAVSLMTIHKSKGLEWDVVFIPDLARGRVGESSQILVDPEIGIGIKMDGDEFDKVESSIYQLIKAKKDLRELAEMRRLLYVAITRAREKVFLTATKDKGYCLDILRPGLDATGIVDEVIDYDDKFAVAPSPGELEPFAKPQTVNIEPLSIGLRELPVTALTVFAKCPLQFKFQYVDGHPGLIDMGGSAMAVGSLTHLALELDITTAAELQRESIESTIAQATEAVDLANRYRSHSEYIGVRSALCDREVPFMKQVDSLKLFGVADLVGQEFVLDYKTDSELHPEEHRFQLWAYAEAFQRTKAYIAYLRHDTLHAFGSAELASIADEVRGLIDDILKGNYQANPSEKTCGYCQFQTVCDKSVIGR